MHLFIEKGFETFKFIHSWGYRNQLKRQSGFIKFGVIYKVPRIVANS